MRLEDMLPFIEEAFTRGQSVVIPVTGISMRPTWEPGDAVTLAPIGENPIKQGDVLLYRRADGRFVLHRVVKVKADAVDCCGDAQVEVEKGVPKAAVIGRVIAYERDGQTYAYEALHAAGRKSLRSRPWRTLATRFHKMRTTDSETPSPFWFIARYLKRQLFAIVLMCVLSCVSAAAMLGMTFASGNVIDKALGNEMHDFRDWFLILFALLIVVAVSHILYTSIRVRACGRMRNEMRRDLFACLLTKQYTSVQELHSGDILNRITGDLGLVVDTALTLIPHIFSIVTKLIGGLTFLFLAEPLFTSILVVGGAVFAVVLQIFSRLYKHLHKECQESEGRARSYLQECLENITIIKSFSSEKQVLEKLDDYQQINLDKQIKRNFYSNIGSTAVYIGFTFAYYAALAWGVLRIAGVIGKAMSVGTFTVLLQVMEQIRSPFRGASGLLPQIYAMLASAERLLELTALPSEKRPPLPQSLPSLYASMKEIVFENVSFAYEDEKSVFCDMSVRFEKGKLTVIMGASGGGKSTLVKLLLGLIAPQSGRVVMQDHAGVCVDINASTRGLFAFVPQGNMLLSGTLLENITFGNTTVSPEAIDRVVQLACLEETVAALPHGLDTVIGERGVGLSEGQIQRVAVARALLSPAPILLLDECTSALDVQTEKCLLENLHKLKDRTVIFVSHRTAVLEAADAVVRVQDRGMVADSNEGM